jgi:hypothetical protein
MRDKHLGDDMNSNRKAIVEFVALNEFYNFKTLAEFRGNITTLTSLFKGLEPFFADDLAIEDAMEALSLKFVKVDDDWTISYEAKDGNPYNPLDVIRDTAIEENLIAFKEIKEVAKQLFILETDLGHFGTLEDGTQVPLDFIMEDEYTCRSSIHLCKWII